MALLDPHPALKAVSPQASPADMFLGDDFHHNGAFRLSYGFEYVAMMETDKGNTIFKFDRHDTFEWYLKLGPLSNVNAEVLQGQAADLERLRRPPQLRRVLEEAGVRAVPDAGDGADAERRRLVGPGRFLRPAQDLRDCSRSTTRTNQNFLVVGPWNHGGWSGGDRATGSARSPSTATRASTSATRCRRRASPTTSRTRAS